MGRQLNHVELVYRPGERALATRVFELLGCTVADRGGTFLTAFVEPTENDFTNNCFYASEMTAEQVALEDALGSAMHDGSIAADAHRYLERLRSEPQRSFHFGVRHAEIEDLDAAVERIDTASRDDGELAGRISVSGVYRPGDPGSYTDTMVQAFVRTDVVASGLLAFGQHVELQWQLPE
ncbi:MAG: hypothetical protein WEE69_08275 [Acidimicrobiia bacterium]